VDIQTKLGNDAVSPPLLFVILSFQSFSFHEYCIVLYWKQRFTRTISWENRQNRHCYFWSLFGQSSNNTVHILAKSLLCNSHQRGLSCL